MQLQFNDKFFENVLLRKNGFLARRSFSWKTSRLFSNRPILINELIRLKIKETNAGFKGNVKFGVTYLKPEFFVTEIGKNKNNQNDAIFMNKLHEQYCRPQNVLSFVVNSNGIMSLNVNSFDADDFLNVVVDITRPFWLVIEISGVVSAIEFIENVEKAAKSGSVEITEEKICSHDIDWYNAELEKVRDDVLRRKYLKAPTDSGKPAQKQLDEFDMNDLPKSSCITADSEVFKSDLNLAAETETSFLTRDENINNSPSDVSIASTSASSSAVKKKSGSSMANTDNFANLCAICLDRVLDTVIRPCNHLCACYGCAFNTWQVTRRCPICRMPIEDIFRMKRK